MKPLVCDGCRACCQSTPNLRLHPEHGDDPQQYLSAQFDGVWRIVPDGSGSCRYLGRTGCTIYDRRPMECRALDCRGLLPDGAATMSRPVWRKVLRDAAYPDVLRAARARL